ncbi:MAG: type IV secretion protein Rhs [Pseudopedobacter saltans]|uniref:Type IV secretion protein Rhs n=1 Tax=Pseudopedobacter saltans TaxID=151895 RepID=A0A2W5F4P5_9SPHI|nr:MAG: type IV secretion protein Rhs [Pseudopedobacter saltans]
MANIVNTTVNIGSDALPYYSSVRLSQHIFDHDTFSLVLPSEYVEGKDSMLFQKAKDLIGQDFTIQSGILGADSNTLQFTGIITHVRRTRSNGYSGDIIVTGFGPTILLDSGPHCKSWKQKTLKSIFDDVLKHFPANRLNAKVNPRFSDTLDYTVQYRETAWEFLKRMCATYGEWLYYDGESLIVGEPEKGKTEGLIFGSDLGHFNLGMEVRPVNKKVMSYDYSNTAVYSGNPKSAQQKAGLDELGNHAWKTSQSLYATTPKSWDNDNMVSAGQLDEAIDIRSAMTGGSLVVFEGEGSYPGLSLCGSIHVSGSNIYSFESEDYGTYTPIAVTHNLGINNSYTNSFQAIPGTVLVPPVDAPVVPRCETQSAKVVSNNDPQGMGRIQVRFHWMSSSETTPWIRVTTPHAGGGKGMYFIPEVDEEVIIGFEGDSAIKPYVIGAVYNSAGNNSFGNAGNDVKALQSRSGCLVMLNDSDGSVHVISPNGNYMYLNGDGSIDVVDKSGNKINMDNKEKMTLTVPNTFTINCGETKLEMIKDGKINITGKEITLEGSTFVTNAANENSGFTVRPSTIDIQTTKTVSLSSGSQANLNSAEINVGASGDTNIQGKKVNIN